MFTASDKIRGRKANLDHNITYWLLPQREKDPPRGDIEILEVVEGDRPLTVDEVRQKLRQPLRKPLVSYKHEEGEQEDSSGEEEEMGGLYMK